MANELAGHVALITGGGRGFGKAIAMAFAAQGAAVTVTARSTNQIDGTVAEIKAAGGKAFAVPGDVTHRKDVERVVAAAQKHFGPATLLVNNAGIDRPFGPIGIVDPDEWWASHAIHVRGPLLYMSGVLPEMIKARAGRIINVASLGGTRVEPNLSSYCVGKATEIRLTEQVAAEVKPHGISAFAIEPGTVFTAMAEHTINDPQAQRWMPGMIEVLKKIKEQSDPAVGLARCARMCISLASGKYDALSGRYLTPDDDFDALARDVNK
ncbi:MAG TPA: SDR family NAD(P)-dependent oxidoreductase [Steroidobacteraceae bacterium]|nr:SDR family NAD(P)-dependent oxidoreductase [Steroidobacteraceae bacterium]